VDVVENKIENLRFMGRRFEIEYFLREDDVVLYLQPKTCQNLSTISPSEKKRPYLLFI